jgi:drug/metabolite transporter (DMT)-like permease
MDPVMALLGASAIGCLIALPLALATGGWVNPLVPWQKAEWALVLASLCHVVAYTGYVWMVGVTGAVFASQIAYVVTLSGVFLSSILLSELYSGWVWSALALMVAGLAMVQPRRSRKAVVAQ